MPSHVPLHHEATDLASRGLEVLKFLTESAQRAKQEMKLRMTRGVSLMATKGFASTEVKRVFAHGRELFYREGPSPGLFNILWSSGLYYQFTGKMQSSLEVSDQLLQMAEGLHNGPLTMEAHRSIGAALVIMGRLREAGGGRPIHKGIFSKPVDSRQATPGASGTW